MLANTQSIASSGSLAGDVHLHFEQLHELIEFIANELPSWRDDPEREQVDAEQRLSDQLCSHLNEAARKSLAWSFLQFRTEVPGIGNRVVDIGVKPCGAKVVVDGRRHTKYDMILPIECKRLPTPTDGERDEQEYVITRNGSTGGIQRFKFGHHGDKHNLAGMIAYVQAETFDVWESRIAGWIRALAQPGALWSANDCLQSMTSDRSLRLATYKSTHRRTHAQRQLDDIELRHLWIDMAKPTAWTRLLHDDPLDSVEMTSRPDKSAR